VVLGLYYCHCFVSLSFLFFAVLPLLNITCTPTTNTLISSGKAAISAVSGHSNALKAGGRQRKGNEKVEWPQEPAGRSQPVHPRRVNARLAPRLASLWPGLSSLSLQSPLSSLSPALLLSGLSLPVSVCPCLQAANSSVLFLYCRSCSHRIAALLTVGPLHCRPASYRLDCRFLHRSCLQPACLPRTQDRERHDSIPVASL
jgi:hypothetical protein